jgi:hypothetical protein
MPFDIDKISEDIKSAKIEADKLRHIADGGTCNFDSAYLRARGMREQNAKVISELSGVPCTISNSRFYGRIMFIGIGEGQANRRTVMAEAVAKFMGEKGHDVGMYYQMD